MKTTAATIIILALLCAPAAAREGFVTPEQSHPLAILPTPPAPHSATSDAELAELHRIESVRTAEQVASAQADDENQTIFLFKTVFGEKFTKENLPAVAALGARLKADESANTGAAKEAFHRIRPYNVDKTLHPVCKTKTKDDSYPSGHTTVGYLMGLALIDIAPERRDEILARAEAYGHNRLVCGVHFPSDVAAARLVAYAVHAIMELDPSYQKEVAAARAELRGALGLAAAH
ncbi:acid phosphatase [Methylosinus sporium]|uniref:Acid phosphatase n=1 Tax=Methylosinus sporium TaxID=428 RepID=A0A2U1SM98_METSR|nr:phosphatase PAP2 family protein [Methylosinus sporium]PWB92741.1 PA-phosphatase [Methylosinus sporium]